MYNYDHDSPFEAFITNLGKYNEGALVGEWVKFPTTHENLQDVFKRIGIDGIRYEEWFITDYDCYVEGIYDVLGEYESLDELNYLAASIEAMDKYDYGRFEAAVEYGEYTGSVKDLINLTENLDCYDMIPGANDHSDLGYYYIHDAGIYDLKEMGTLANYIDYERFGRDVAMDESGQFTSRGYVTSGRDSFTEHYDGDRENIPDEYRIMSGAAGLTDDERMEMAMDLAFDLDEFFRQKDPQYAAANPDSHLGKEFIADLLMEGKTAAFKEKLAEMAQTPDDQLPSQIGEYERATGYEDYLDTDVAAVRDKLEQGQEGIKTYEIYQLKKIPDWQFYAFEPLDRLREHLRGVDMQNYDKVYSGAMPQGETLESLYTRFNVDRPEDFKGRSLSVSDVIVVYENGQDTAYYCDSFGFTSVPEFFTQENYLKNAEMAMEDDYGMIDGIINNGKKEIMPSDTDEKPSLHDRLADAKRECAERTPPEIKKPERNGPEHDL